MFCPRELVGAMVVLAGIPRPRGFHPSVIMVAASRSWALYRRAKAVSRLPRDGPVRLARLFPPEPRIWLYGSGQEDDRIVSREAKSCSVLTYDGMYTYACHSLTLSSLQPKDGDPGGVGTTVIHPPSSQRLSQVFVGSVFFGTYSPPQAIVSFLLTESAEGNQGIIGWALQVELFKSSGEELSTASSPTTEAKTSPSQ